MNNFNQFTHTDGGHWEAYQKAVKELNQKHEEWVAKLRAEGFKAAHPNDGWVDRKNNELQMAYPDFNDGMGVGDKVMLGWHDQGHRPAVITGIRHSVFNLTFWKFEDLK